MDNLDITLTDLANLGIISSSDEIHARDVQLLNKIQDLSKDNDILGILEEVLAFTGNKVKKLEDRNHELEKDINDYKGVVESLQMDVYGYEEDLSYLEDKCSDYEDILDKNGIGY